MKNVHVLQTDKPSNIVISTIDGKLKLNNNPNDNVEYHGENQHIYITSDEEIKEGDRYVTNNGKIAKELYSIGRKGKIILTTDQDLIEYGVQAIDDEFLEWFVKNPSCESVEVSYEVLKPFQSEEKGYLIHCPDNEVLEEPKQETIREVVKRYYEDNIDESNIPREHYEWEIQDLMIGFAYQWEREQDKNKYSEEEVYKLTLDALDLGMTIRQNQLNGYSDKSGKELHKKWFEQFKKQIKL